MIFKPQSFHGETPAVAEEHPPEADLEQRVAEALALTDATGALDLKVVASGSEIFLLAAASSEEEMARAVETALSVQGVAKVTVRLSNA
jgi:osmotically-inducible protein OsmY